MNLFLLRHTDAIEGEQMDSSRTLSKQGLADAETVAAFLARQIGRVDIVISSPFVRTMQTAGPAARALGSYVATTTALEPDGTPEPAWEEIKRLAQQSGDVLVVSHGPMLSELLAWFTMRHYESGDGGAGLRFPKGATAMLDTSKGWRAELRWLATVPLVERDEDAAAVTEAARSFIDALAEARGEYTYEDIEEKRWVLGSGGASGENCEDCQENADAGWIEQDELYPAGDDLDAPPCHPSCSCSEEYRTRRKRVKA